MVQVNIRGWLGVFALGLEKAGLKADDVVAQLIVLLLNSFVAVVQGIVFADLRLQALDVAFLSLSEGSL